MTRSITPNSHPEQGVIAGESPDSHSEQRVVNGEFLRCHPERAQRVEGSKFYIERLNTSVRLNFVNFSEMPSVGELSPQTKYKEADIDIHLFEDGKKFLSKKVKKGPLRGLVKKTRSGRYLELFYTEKRKTFSFFEKGIPLNFAIDHAVNRSFLTFQSSLNMIFLHAASVVIKNKACLFVAPSGGGKTTFCSLAARAGHDVLNDEFCAVKKKDNRFFTGMIPSYLEPPDPYADREISAVYFLEKSEINRLQDISRIEAISRTLPQATYFHVDHVPNGKEVAHKKHVFYLLDALFGNIRFKLLKFNKKAEVFLCLS